MRTTVTVVTRAACEDAVIEAPSSTPTSDVLLKLRELVGASPDATVVIDGSAVDHVRAMTPVGAGALHEGAIVSFGATQHVEHATSCLELRIVGGPAAGSSHRLAMGTTRIGRGMGSSAGVSIDDSALSRRHAVLTLRPNGVTVADGGSTNGTLLDDAWLGAEPVPMLPGMRLHLGESTAILAGPPNPPVAITAIADGGQAFNRPPRLGPPALSRVIVPFPVKAAERDRARVPLIATIAPLAAGVVLALVMRRPEYLLFTALSPLMMGGQWVSDRVGQRRSRRADNALYADALAAAHAELKLALLSEEATRRERSPDPATIGEIAAGPSARLWERRRRDPDFLVVGLGRGALAADVDVGPQPVSAAPVVVDVPITVSLRDVGVLGLAGPSPRIQSIARSLVGQLVVLHSPRDVSVVLLTETPSTLVWDWLRWLPHTRPTSDLQCQALLGLDTDSVAARVSELVAIVDARVAMNDVEAKCPAIVVVVDGARALRRSPALGHVLAQGPQVGIVAICLEDEPSSLPEECRAVAELDGETGTHLMLRLPGAPSAIEAIGDGVAIAWAERVARHLAPLRDVGPHSAESTLPAAVRWLDAAGLGADLSADVMASWSRSGNGTTRALIGARADGPFVIDLARDGPHALVAGTTGAGKSEFLQTLVASLALANRPDHLAFVLIDYKGGAAFGACADLPHTVGLVTDLDGRLVERALASLSAELKHREGLLAAAGVPDIDTFRSAGGLLARLVIVVDEFASLAEELPEFVGGLVGIAQRGRSLGVHLVLATQRPEGVVSPDIRANTNLRICLAVTRDSESRDVIDSPNAARIHRTTPGRGFARTGHGELCAFQTGRVGGPARQTGQPVNIDVRLSPFRSLCLPASPTIETALAATESDLDRIVAACRTTALTLGIEPARSPWLAPLPPTLSVAALAGADPLGYANRPLTATLGLHDIPGRQAQTPYIVDLAQLSHLLIVGCPRSGRTTALRSLCASLAMSSTVAELHVFGIDCAGGALNVLTALPHCGAVVSLHEASRARRLFSMLATTLVERQHLLAEHGLTATREPPTRALEPLPQIAVLIDGWEAFVLGLDDVDGGALVEQAWRLMREGAAVGIHLIITADRAGLVGKLASTIENRLVLRLADRTDFSLIGLPARHLPASMPAGRGYFADGLVETQVCVLGDDPSGPAQLRALSEVARIATSRDTDVATHQRPRRVDPLPTRVTLREAGQARSRAIAPTFDRAATSRSAVVVLGVGGDELNGVGVDLLQIGPGFVVAGPPRSGRSTALATIASCLQTDDWHVVAIAPRPSVLHAQADQRVDLSCDALDRALAEATMARRRCAVLIDDAELVTDSPIAPALDRLMRSARDAGQVVVIAGTVDDLSVGFRGFVVDARRSRAGLLLNPRGPLDGEVFGVRLPRGIDADSTPGRGLLAVRGTLTALQVAVP